MHSSAQRRGAVSYIDMGRLCVHVAANSFVFLRQIGVAASTQQYQEFMFLRGKYRFVSPVISADLVLDTIPAPITLLHVKSNVPIASRPGSPCSPGPSWPARFPNSVPLLHRRGKCHGRRIQLLCSSMFASNGAVRLNLFDNIALRRNAAHFDTALFPKGRSQMSQNFLGGRVLLE